MRRVVASIAALVALSCSFAVDSHGADAQGVLLSTPDSTSTTLSDALEDDFLVLYPEYDDQEYQYLLPDDSTADPDILLPETGYDMRIGLGALALMAVGAIVFAVARAPKRRSSR